MGILKLLAISTISICLQGCATGTVQLKDEVRKNISSIELEKNVPFPNNPYFYGPKQGIASVLIGPLAVAAINGQNSELNIFFINEDIEIGEIGLQAFKRALKADQTLGNKLTEDGEYKLRLKVGSYGLF